MEDQKKPIEKKPYEAPAILSEEVFETLALACGKVPTDIVCAPGGVGGNS